MSSLIAAFWPYIAGAIALIVGALGLRASGAASERAKQAQLTLKSSGEVQNAKDSVDALADSAVSNELKSGWVRKP